jgi:hypothetical protein
MPPTAELRRRREAIVKEHMESENRHEFDDTLETFDQPRYELGSAAGGHRATRLPAACAAFDRP